MGWTFTLWIQKLQTGVMATAYMLWALCFVAACLTYASLNSYCHSPPTVNSILS